MAKVVKTLCFHCPVGCGIDVHVENNKPVKVEGMMESVVGPICVRAEVIPEWYETALKDRLLHPLKRDRLGFKEISWDEAFDIIIDKLNKIKDKYGPEAFITWSGLMGPNRDWTYLMQRFHQAYGSPGYIDGVNFCWAHRLPGHFLTYGEYSSPTLRTKCICCWGGNPVESVPFTGDIMLELKRKGESKLLVVDCRRTMLAKEADVHLMPLPGTDPAIALGLLNVVINEGLYDKEFVEKWTVGFDKLVDRVKDYPPERVEQLTTVPAEKLREFARVFATTKPATIFTGNTLDNVDGGLYAHRGMDILWAITGNVGARGGSRLIPMNLFTKVSCEPGKPIPLNYDDLLEDCRFVSPRKFWGEDKYPMFVSVIAGGVMSCAVDAMLEGKIKAMIIQAANMHSTWANTNRWKRAMSQLDFLVVYDIVMTEDAEFADLVLPATTFLEKQFVFNYGYRPLWALGNVAIEPPPDCRSEMWFWLELAKRMGFKDYLPFDTVDEAQNHLAGKYGLTLDDLRRNPGGVFYSKAGAMDKAYEKTGFKTPSGKVEIYSERAKEWGLDPLPTYVPPIQSPAGRPDIAKRYPLWLITGTRMIEYHESMLRCVPTLRAKQPDPLAEIHTDVARALGINDGDPVIIETLAGKCEMKAKVSEDIHPQVVSTTQGWWRMNNPNLLTMDEEGARCPETGCPIMRAIACRVAKSVMRG